MNKIFCNVHLFRVPRRWTGSVQMKSNISFIRGKRCIVREKDNFKSREVKRLKECALALNNILISGLAKERGGLCRRVAY